MRYIIVLALYYLALILIGYYSSRKIKVTVEGYLLAGRSAGTAMIAATLAATWYGGGMLMGTAEWAYGSGISNVWSWEFTAVALLLAGLFLAKPIRNLEVVTLPEVFKMRFDNKNQILLAVINIVILFAFLGMQVLAIGTITRLLVPSISENLGLLIGVAIILFYVFVGGQLSVLLTDFLQFILLAVGTIMAALYSVRAAGGIDHLINALPPTFVSPTGVGTAAILGWLLSYFPASMIEQEIWRKVNTAETASAAQKGTVFAGLILIALTFLTPFAGLAAKVIYPNIKGVEALPYMALNAMPVWAGSVVLIAVFAAVMSNASAYLIDGAAMLSLDLYGQITGTPREKLVHLSRYMIIGMGLCAVVVAKLLPSIMGLASLAYAIYAPVCFFPLILGFFWKRVSSNSAFYSMLIVLVVEIYLYAAGQPWGNPALIGFPLSLLLIIVLSLVLPPDDKQSDIFFKSVKSSKAKVLLSVIIMSPLVLIRQAKAIR
ncbi:sodium/proline symporter [Moorella thermoacetica]|uniref:Sodium/proline symporter n=2 Tax=Neomoorella thermoacetica TaxID=1525 RepID=A0A1J5JF50_NEOTH|nr:sodium/proline symporter [Moorella thermoacetica]OIQ59366.1 sodium/proline symporter [Moorella thermoacetica]